MKTTPLLTLAALLAVVVGCEVPEIDTPAATSTGEQSSNSQDTSEPTLFGKEDWYLPDGRVDMSGVPDEPPMTTSVPREVVAKDPKKGKLTRKKGGKLLGTTLQAGPSAENQIVFTIFLPRQLSEYDARKGHPVQSHKEFMDDFLNGFVQENKPGFKLPKLEPGDAYLYDPDDKKLKIFRPSEPGAPQVEGVVAYEAEPEDTEE